MKTKIYTLCDETGLVRYVGRTCRRLSSRLCSHLWDARNGAKNHRCNWIRSILSRGYLPSIKQIAEVEGDGYAEESEWICYFRKRGVKLVNSTDGGPGHRGFVPSEEHRRKSSERLKKNHIGVGHVVTPEVREILRQKSTGRPKTKAELEKISSALMGIVRSQSTRRKMSESKRRRFTPKQLKEWAAQMAAARAIKCWPSAETRRRMSESRKRFLRESKAHCN